MFKTKKKHLLLKWLSAIFAIFFVITISLVITFFTFEKKYQARIYPGVMIGNVDLSGLTANEAMNKLNLAVDIINQNGVPFHYFDLKSTLYPVISSVEGDLAYQIIDFNVEESAIKAFKLCRKGTFMEKLKGKISMYFNKKSIPLKYSLHEEEIDKFLKNNFSKFETPASNANLIYTGNDYYTDISFEVEEEKFGQVLIYDKAIDELKIKLAKINNDTIELKAEINYPNIYKKDVKDVEKDTKEIIEKTPLQLTHNGKTWWVKKSEVVAWLDLKENPDKFSTKKVVIGLNNEKVNTYLDDYIAPKINIEPIDAKFEIANGKVKEFQKSQDGFLLDNEASIKVIESELTSSSTSLAINLITISTEAITADEVNEMGINELLGTGHSSFAGSPSNRRHNIQTGADAVNGTLIKPGDEFSLLAVLGEINKKTGYLPELVIKDNKTIPEYGGGLCQIGTTVFRGTLAAGLPVTSRRNHSYRVSYYEPAGTDATIYDPWPDYKFINDTNSHVLIQSRIDGDDIYFDFWGTSDGRVATSTYPTIYNIVKPAPTKLIETLDLKPGVKKCTEHAHSGADAYFDYTVTYPSTGTSSEPIVKETRYKSHYVPWREVCLIGVEKLTEELIASTTEKVVE